MGLEEKRLSAAKKKLTRGSDLRYKRDSLLTQPASGWGWKKKRAAAEKKKLTR